MGKCAILLYLKGVRIFTMPVRLRLTRKGAKKKPFYRIVAADSEAPRDGRFLEVLGYYDPLKDPAQVKMDEEKVRKWIQRGATVSDTVGSLLRKKGVPTVPSQTK
jgi:small subunit ribosomal protein S16